MDDIDTVSTAQEGLLGRAAWHTEEADVSYMGHENVVFGVKPTLRAWLHCFLSQRGGMVQSPSEPKICPL